MWRFVFDIADGLGQWQLPFSWRCLSASKCIGGSKHHIIIGIIFLNLTLLVFVYLESPCPSETRKCVGRWNCRSFERTRTRRYIVLSKICRHSKFLTLQELRSCRIEFFRARQRSLWASHVSCIEGR
jgi:hypothetical protein